MPKIKVGIDVLPVKVKHHETVTWEIGAIGSNQSLKVVVKSSPKTGLGETISNKVGPNLKAVDCLMGFKTWNKDVTLAYSLYLITPSATGGAATETQVVTDPPGPSLVIDDIGKPPGACPDDEDDEEKQFAVSYSGTRHERG